jgi:hypothetical protein
MHVDEVLTYIFDGQSNPLLEPMAGWLASSRRFVAFVTAFRDKIRKKVRLAREHGSLLDLQLELETAFLLLRERSLSVAYEPEQSKGARSPDFAVSFTTSLTFAVEVTRLQLEQDEAADSDDPALMSPPGIAPVTVALAARLADTVVGKLGQLLPQRGNVVIVAIESHRPISLDIRGAMLSLQQRAERNDLSLLQRHAFQDRADFFRQYRRLSEVILRMPQSETGAPLPAWINLQAKHPLPTKVRTVLYRALWG